MKDEPQDMASLDRSDFFKNSYFKIFRAILNFGHLFVKAQIFFLYFQRPEGSSHPKKI